VSAIISTRLGERTCVVEVAAALDAGAAERLVQRVDTAMADGCRDFVLDLTAVRGCRDDRPIAALSRLAHRFAGEDCEVVVAARHVDLLAFLDSVPSFSKLPVALARDEALALLLERPVEAASP
jgi:STAS domain-containing protein